MRDYKLLAEGLRYCSKHICNKECGYYEICHRERQDKYPSNINVGFDAADAIEEMLDELTTIRKQFPHWISAEERLPEVGVDVLVADGSNVCISRQVRYVSPTERFTFWSRDDLDLTHWMPLPAPPKEVE